VPLTELHADPANARLHGERNMEAITASLQRFGLAEPLLVQRSTGRVIGGNGRLVAMRALGWTECDIVEVDLDDTQATAKALNHMWGRVFLIPEYACLGILNRMAVQMSVVVRDRRRIPACNSNGRQHPD
jgi:hypothetical protein